MDPATSMFHHGVPVAGGSMFHHGLVLVAHLGPAGALTAAAIAAVVTAGGLAVRRLRHARRG